MSGLRHSGSIVPFPHPVIRAWVVVRVGGGFRGELVGGRDLLDDGPTATDVGTWQLVMQALVRGDVRQGLPIVQMPEVEVRGGAVA